VRDWAEERTARVAIQLRSRHDITIDAFRRVAWNGEKLMVDGGTLRTIDEHRAQFLEFLKRNPACRSTE